MTFEAVAAVSSDNASMSRDDSSQGCIFPWFPEIFWFSRFLSGLRADGYRFTVSTDKRGKELG